MMDALEAIEIQLAKKRLVFSLVEILGHYLFGEASWIQDLEHLATRQPAHDVIEAFLGSIVDHRMELAWKQRRGGRCGRRRIRERYCVLDGRTDVGLHRLTVC